MPFLLFEDYMNGKIKRHELTREEKLKDRTRHANEISAYAEPGINVNGLS